MVKPKDKVWSLFQIHSDKSVTCKFCNNKYKFANVCKMRKHMAKCVKCPADERHKYEKASNSVTSSSSAASTSINICNVQQPSTSNENLSYTNKIKPFVDSMSNEENVNF